MNRKKIIAFALIGVAGIALLIYLYRQQQEKQASEMESEKDNAVLNALAIDRQEQARKGMGVGKFGTKPKFGGSVLQNLNA